MDRTDPVLGLVRRCRCCREEWPLTGEFYAVNNRTPGGRLLSCNACRAEGRTPGRRVYVVTDVQRQKHLERCARMSAEKRRQAVERTRAWRMSFRAEFQAVIAGRPRIGQGHTA